MSEQYNLKTNSDAEVQGKKQRGMWVAGVFTAVSVAFMVISFYAAIVVQQGRFDLEDAILMPTTVILTICSLLSYFLIRQGRYKAGSEILFITIMVMPVMATLVLSNMLAIVIAYTVLFAPMMYNWVLLKTSRRLALVTIMLVILAFIGIAVWNPGFRGVSDVAVNATPVVIALATAALLAITVRQAWGTINSSITSRLTALVLIVTVPLLIAVTAYISSRAGSEIEAQALHNLEQNNQSLAINVSTWLEQHARTTKEMSMLPGITSMSATRQTATLKVIASAHPNLFLVHTLDLAGVNVARNDDAAPINYSDRVWFLNAKEGEPITFDVVISRTLGKPVLAISAPIYDQSKNIVGVAAVISELSEISKEVLDNEAGEGITFIVDANNRVLAHPDPTYTEGDLRDLSAYPPIAALDEGKTGQLTFTDENGVTWIAYVDRLDNGWGIIAQQPEAELLAPVRQFQTVSILLIVIGSVVMFALAWFTIRRSLQPIGELTTTVSAIAAGDLNRVADVKSQDEIGLLASTFNLMTAQLRESFGTLEQRVAERTRNLELAAEVGRTVSQVRSLDVMLTDAAELIRQQFDLYYVQVYLVNPSETYLDLESGTGEVGRQLLSRSHRLPLNTNSINGRAVIEKRSVIISDTGKSASFKPNPLLPDTRSEMAVPLLIGDKVVGVLDMQSTQGGALDQDVLPAFEALAGQLAIAIQNANFLAETEQARAEVEAQARRLVRSNWKEYMDAIHKPERTGFVFQQGHVLPMTESDELQKAGDHAFAAPIAITGEAFGNLIVELDENSSSAHGTELAEAVARQVSQQVESLRLLETAERFRHEVEAASRRLTREGWKDYVQTNAEQTLGYYYDLKEVRPYREDEKEQHEDTTFTLPLKVHDETIGKLAVEGLAKEDDESMNLVLAVAERLSAHIEGLRQFEETQRGQIELDKRAQQLAAVAEVSTASSQELDVQKMLESVVFLTQRKFGLYHAHVFLYNENTEELRIAACGWKEGDEHEGTHGTTTILLQQEQSLVARAARTRTAVIVNDVRNEPGWLPNPLLPDTASELAVPLVSGDQILGVLDVQSDRINAFTEEDASIQTTLASQVATALQNARSFARAQQQAQRESALNVISQKIQSATTVEAVLQIAARELGHALGAPMTIAQLSMKDSSS